VIKTKKVIKGTKLKKTEKNLRWLDRNFIDQYLGQGTSCTRIVL